MNGYSIFSLEAGESVPNFLARFRQFEEAHNYSLRLMRQNILEYNEFIQILHEEKNGLYKLPIKGDTR